jgi:ribosomal subunit interface protein
MVEFHNRSDAALASDFKEIALLKIESLKKYCSDITRTKIDILEGSGHKSKSDSHEIAIALHTTKTVYKAEGLGSSNLIAFDQAFASLEAQLRKSHSKNATSKSRKPGIKGLKPKED